MNDHGWRELMEWAFPPGHPKREAWRAEVVARWTQPGAPCPRCGRLLKDHSFKQYMDCKGIG